MKIVNQIKYFTAFFIMPLSGLCQVTLPVRDTFYITPVIEGLFLCVDAQRNAQEHNRVGSDSDCARQNYDANRALTQILDDMEPGGPVGQVRIGYTATIQLLNLFKKDKGLWTLDTKKIDYYLNFIKNNNRPVIIYLASNHFDTQSALSRELATDKKNLMLLPNGAPPPSSYFGYTVTPFTLRTDEKIPVNLYRFKALRYISQQISKWPPSVQNRIVAVTLAGELHQMFLDFENGMGAFEKIEVTDYHPESIAQFRDWLQQKYGTIENFNKINNFKYSNFDSIPAPSKNIRKDQLQSFGEHYDGFAHGLLHISGWLWSPSKKLDKLSLFIDGEYIADIPQGLNRLDVYRAVEEITDPSVGFRYDYAYENLSVGRHIGQVVAQVDEKKYQVAQFDFNVMARDQSKIPITSPKTLKSLSKIDQLKGTRAWLDLPKSQQDLYFNPLARDWNHFREHQVLNLLQKFYTTAKSAGISDSKLYSHQIIPQVNSSWNHQLFAVDETLRGDHPWGSGINMYGGATNSDWVKKFIENKKIIKYGAPEFNPQQWKNPEIHMNAMLTQYKNGAHFISPYYISISSDRSMTDRSAVTSMEIRPDNKAEGSANFYHAIRKLAKE